jgi:hemolysin III
VLRVFATDIDTLPQPEYTRSPNKRANKIALTRALMKAFLKVIELPTRSMMKTTMLASSEYGMFEGHDGVARQARNYTKAEMVADGVVHFLGLVFAVCGGIALMLLASRSASWSTIATAAVYATSLLVALAFSAAYNMWPVSRVKWLLRRCDQAAIFVLIGGTYTAFLTRAANDPPSLFVLAVVWTGATVGALLKLVMPGRFDRASIAAYLTLGWCGVVLLPTAMQVLPLTSTCLIALGGVLYSAGVIFHLWERLQFQNAIWHAFVLVAATCHYGAVLVSLVAAPT